jgi:NADPH:quinone reductase-like Zn-dependent oxidoreductase
VRRESAVEQVRAAGGEAVCAVRGFWVINWIRTAPREEIERTYAELVELVEQGVLHAAVEATYPLAAYREAFAHALRPQRSGKVLFEFDGAAA